MRVAVVPTWGGGALLRRLTEDGRPASSVQVCPDLVAAIREWERTERPRWVWAATTEIYPAALEAGVPVGRCHDVALTEGLLLSHQGRWGEPRSLAAAWARLGGHSAPDDPPVSPRQAQPALFEPAQAGFPDEQERLGALVEVHADQLRRLADTEHPARLGLLVAAESAAALAAAEMSRSGLPWRVDVHDAVLTELLGPRPPAGALPPRLRELAMQITTAFGGRPVNADSPAEVLRAFARQGIHLPSTRSWVLQRVDHPAAALLLRYKELARLHSAYGWAWADTWVRSGRFRPEYVPGAVVSGRWASRGGGALQIPHVLRRAVVADPGWVLVVADASQLEPRVLAALSGDPGLARAAAAGDLYQALADEAFDGDRGRAKVALLSAMYGGVSGAAGMLLAALRRRFPAAVDYVEAAARTGERGGLVRSRLGRTCPAPSQRWRELVVGRGDGTLAGAAAHAGPAGTAPLAAALAATGAGDGAGLGSAGYLASYLDGAGSGGDAGEGEWGGGRQADQAVRDRGRFTRNFVVQASAADWALVLLAALRRRLSELPGPSRLTAGDRAAPPTELAHRAEPADPNEAVRPNGSSRAALVFFQHDEVIVHCPAEAAPAVVAEVAAAGAEAGQLVFPGTPVRFPLQTSVVHCYAEAK